MGDTRRISKTGKSKKLEKLKKKKQLVETDLSSNRGEENQGDDAEVEVYQMSSGDEDFSKGVKNETLEISGVKKKSKKSRDEKRKKVETTRSESQEFDTQSKQAEAKLQKSNKKKRKNVENINMVDEVNDKDDDQSEQAEDKLQKSKKKKRKNVEKINKVDEVNERDDASEQQIGKSKKPGKMKKKQLVTTDISSDNLLEKRGDDTKDEVYEMSSGDEDYSKGMKKWITEYHQSRPGLKVLQERIDDFIVAHEAKEEQAKAEKEAQAAEGGWTVVVHHRGRKKTTEAESGVAVGSVAQAAVLDNMGKKKKKEVGLDFYRFQKKEAHRNEIMMLQSKFEQDKKRIQQMRAARKFRPY